MASIHRATPLARRIGRAAAAGVMALGLVAAGMPGSTATPSSRLHTAKGRLTALTNRITSEEAVARQLEDRLTELDVRIADARSRIAGIDAQIMATQRQVTAANARIASLQRRLDAIARGLFMQGAGSVQASIIGQLLGSPSIGDLNDLLTYGEELGRSDVDLGDRIGYLKASLGFQLGDLQRLRTEQVQLMAQLADERATQADALAEQRTALAALDRTRGRIVDLIAHLHQEIRAEALAAVGTAFQGQGHVTYGAWAGAFARTIGAPTCRSNLVALVTWQYSEFTQAGWNPLADTLQMPGSTVFNSAGVQNYVSLGQGLAAVRHTLTNGPTLGYPAIVAGLRACADAMTTARAVNASSWCRGCAGGQYVTGWIAKVEANYDLYARL